jgi:hypothetical protein
LQLVKMPVLSLIAGNNEMQVLAILLSTWWLVCVRGTVKPTTQGAERARTEKANFEGVCWGGSPSGGRGHRACVRVRLWPVSRVFSPYSFFFVSFLYFSFLDCRASLHLRAWAFHYAVSRGFHSSKAAMKMRDKVKTKKKKINKPAAKPEREINEARDWDTCNRAGWLTWLIACQLACVYATRIRPTACARLFGGIHFRNKPTSAPLRRGHLTPGWTCQVSTKEGLFLWFFLFTWTWSSVLSFDSSKTFPEYLEFIRIL